MNMPRAIQVLDGKFEVIEKLRDGGMGSIYKVRHRLLEEIRVAKVMRPHLVGSDEYRERFLREARTSIKLRHDNIAEIYDFHLEEGVAYIVMEFIDGLNLAQLLRRIKPLPAELVVEVGIQSLDALAYLHKKGFVHRDISPDNLMLTIDEDQEPLVKLIDLGIVKGMDGDGLTRTGAYLGKLQYSAPEQFGAGSGQLDQRSDIYSLGVVLYELATGRCPIQGDNPAAIIGGHLVKGPKSFVESDPDGKVPEKLRAAIIKALHREPDERFDDAKSFVKDLRAIGLNAKDLDVARLLTGEIGIEDGVMQTIASDIRPPAPKPSARRQKKSSTLSLDDIEDLIDTQKPRKGTPRTGPGTPRTGSPAPAPALDEHLEILVKGSRKLLQLGHFEEASAQLEVAMRMNPDHPMVRELEKQLQSSDPEEAGTRAAMLASIQSLVDAGELEAARSMLDSAESVIADSQIVENLRSRIDRKIFDSEDVDQMLEALFEGRSAIEVKPSEVAGRGTKRRDREISAATESVESFIKDGQLRDARRALDIAERLVGDTSVFVVLRGQIDNKIADLKQSHEKIERQLEMARSVAGGGDFETALAVLDEAESLDPDHEGVKTLKEEIEQAYLKIAEQRRMDAEVAEIITRVEHRIDSGRLEDAAAVLDASISELGSHPLLLVERRRLDKMVEQRRRTEAKDRLTAARRFATEGDLRAACQVIDEAWALDPDNEEIGAAKGELELAFVGEKIRSALDLFEVEEARELLDQLSEEASAETGAPLLAELEALEKRIVDDPVEVMAERVDRLLEIGRPNRAKAVLTQLAALRGEDPRLDAVEKNVESFEAVKAVSGCLERGEMTEARRALDLAIRMFGLTPPLEQQRERLEAAEKE